MKINIYTKKTQTTKVGIQKRTKSTKRRRKMISMISLRYFPFFTLFKPFSISLDTKIDSANKEIRFYRDLNSDRWIQSPEC